MSLHARLRGSHGSYHRSQLAVVVKPCGGVSEQTDFVGYACEAGVIDAQPAAGT